MPGRRVDINTDALLPASLKFYSSGADINNARYELAESASAYETEREPETKKTLKYNSAIF